MEPSQPWADHLIPDPVTPTQQSAAAVHEMYSSYVAAGFTCQQAMQLLCAHIAASAPGGGQS